MNRREFLSVVIGGCVGLAAGGAAMLGRGCTVEKQTAEAFIGRAGGYDADIPSIIGAGLRELGVAQTGNMRGKESFSNPTLLNLIKVRRTSTLIPLSYKEQLRPSGDTERQRLSWPKAREIAVTRS